MDEEYSNPELSFAHEFARYIVILISIVVLLFDHCLTFSSEVEHIWRKTKTPFSCLFLLNRYYALSAMLVYTALYIVPHKGCQDVVIPIDMNSSYNYSDCGAATPFLFAFTVVTSLAAEAAITLRAYAVHRNSKPILLILSAVWITHLALSISVYVGSKGGIAMSGSSHAQAPGLVLTQSEGAIFLAPAVAFDVIAGGFLTLGLYRQSGPGRVQMPLTRLIIRDGLLYFVVVFVSNAVWIVIHYLNRRHYNVAFLYFTPIEIWSGCITTTMISRLTLNLRMYDPAAQKELTFQTMSLMLRGTRQLATADDEMRHAGGSGGE